MDEDQKREAPSGIQLTIGGRKIAWQASDQIVAIMAQEMVSLLGPGKEVD